MQNNDVLAQALRRNGEWFLQSGVMNPPSGEWGVAERILLASGNSALEKALRSFPAWNNFPGGCVLEQRRPDCNFEAAYYFLLLESLLDERKFGLCAEGILHYLYRLSGMLSPDENMTLYPPGVWTWSNIRWTPAVWFDDNSWCILLALLIAARRSDLEQEYRMTEYALRGAEAMAEAFERHYEHKPGEDGSGKAWSGDLQLPHWGALCMTALAAAARVKPEFHEKWQSLVLRYFTDVMKRLAGLTTSEQAYALFALAVIAGLAREKEKESFLAMAQESAALLLNAMDPDSACLPSAHYEAPNGEHLVDLIYTQNWAALALQNMRSLSPSPLLDDRLEKMTSLLIRIQDLSDGKELHGCWRGMYDLNADAWGGGDCYEGGANSIYTGWTNAPLGWFLAFQLSGSSLACEIWKNLSEQQRNR